MDGAFEGLLECSLIAESASRGYPLSGVLITNKGNMNYKWRKEVLPSQAGVWGRERRRRMCGSA